MTDGPVPAPTRYSNADLYLVIEAALTDATHLPQRRDQLIRSLVLACMDSTQAFKKLQALRPPGALPRGELRELLTRAGAGCKGLPEREGFRHWVENSGTAWDRLLGEGFLDSLFHAPDPAAILSASQKRAWKILQDFARLQFSPGRRRLPIVARTSLLIAGPTGVGKSHLIESFAAAEGLAYLRLTFGGWMVTGAKQEPWTAEIVQKFLTSHPRCLIHVDELDKVSHHRSEWAVALLNELYALLDRTWFSATGEHDRTINTRAARQLKENCLLVGTGTWQNLWTVAGGAKSPIGFGGGDPTQMPAAIRAARTIPSELLNRFHDDLVLLEPLTRDDFAAILAAAGLEQLAQELGVAVDLDHAVATGLNMRWVEGLSTRLQIRAQAVASPAPSDTAGPLPPSHFFGRA